MEMEDGAVKENSSQTTPLVTLPKPTGPYRIGTAKYDLEDPFRKDLQFSQGRLIPIQIYFPMEQGSHSIYHKYLIFNMIYSSEEWMTTLNIDFFLVYWYHMML